jgi:hypothetical protein
MVHRGERLAIKRQGYGTAVRSAKVINFSQMIAHVHQRL